MALTTLNTPGTRILFFQLFLGYPKLVRWFLSMVLFRLRLFNGGLPQEVSAGLQYFNQSHSLPYFSLEARTAFPRMRPHLLPVTLQNSLLISAHTL